MFFVSFSFNCQSYCTIDKKQQQEQVTIPWGYAPQNSLSPLKYMYILGPGTWLALLTLLTLLTLALEQSTKPL